MCSQVCTLLEVQHARESSVDLVQRRVLIQGVGKGLSVCISNRLQGGRILRLHFQGPHIERQGAKNRCLPNVQFFPTELAGCLHGSCLMNALAVEAQRGAVSSPKSHRIAQTPRSLLCPTAQCHLLNRRLHPLIQITAPPSSLGKETLGRNFPWRSQLL